MTVGAWLVAINEFLAAWQVLAVMVLVLTGLAASALWLTRGMRDPNRDKELERLMARFRDNELDWLMARFRDNELDWLMARVRDTLGEDEGDLAVLAVSERAARDGWDVYRPGGHLNPAFARPFAKEVKKELRRRLSIGRRAFFCPATTADAWIAR
jgi:hypothetical protein